jgi:hypothetical protein
LSKDVQGCKHLISAFTAEHLEKLSSCLGIGVIRRIFFFLPFVFIHFCLAADAGEPEEKLSDKLYGRKANTPALIEETLLQLRKKQINGLRGVVRHDHASSTH